MRPTSLAGLPDRRSSRSTDRSTSITNRFWQAAAAVGLWPRRLAMLEVRAGRGGRPVTLPVVMADVDSQRYLVARLDAHTPWTAHLRAAGGYALLHHGKIEAVRLLELPAAQRAPILRRYPRLGPGAPPRITAGPAGLDPLPAGYPVFRIEPAISRAQR